MSRNRALSRPAASSLRLSLSLSRLRLLPPSPSRRVLSLLRHPLSRSLLSLTLSLSLSPILALLSPLMRVR